MSEFLYVRIYDLMRGAGDSHFVAKLWTVGRWKALDEEIPNRRNDGTTIIGGC